MAIIPTIKNFVLSVSLLSMMGGVACADAPQGKERPPLAEVWVQTSAEYRGLCYQTYAAASQQFDNWASVLEKRADGKAYLPGSNKPVAIILDLDETVIDNSGFQAFTIKTSSSFNPDIWKTWVEFQGINSAAGPTVPGAVEFLAKVEAMGVTPIYVSNREIGMEPSTLKVLERAGINQTDINNRIFLRQHGENVKAEALHVLKVQGTDPDSLSGRQTIEGEGEKEARRRIIRSHYDVVAYFGDVYGDFEPFLSLAQSTKRVFEQRQDSADRNSDKWGRSWFILPNPMYGSWGPGAAIPKDAVRSSLNDYGFETFVRARRSVRLR